MNPTSNNSKQSLLLPITVLISGVLIAGAIYMNRSSVPAQSITVEQQNAVNTDAFVPVSKSDHILGDIDKADVIIVDYSDLECPFCKILHETLMQVYSTFEPTGRVAWVYRHYPMSFHSKAPKEAEAAECVAELGGEKIFWDYVHMIYANTPSNDGLESTQLGVFADKVGVDQVLFNNCMTSGKYATKIKESYDNALKLTKEEISPFTVIVANGKVIPLVDNKGFGLGAALPYSSFKALIDQFLAAAPAKK